MGDRSSGVSLMVLSILPAGPGRYKASGPVAPRPVNPPAGGSVFGKVGTGPARMAVSFLVSLHFTHYPPQGVVSQLPFARKRRGLQGNSSLGTMRIVGPAD